tara:strand:- start:176 stop:1099 length:924 start_codon:yes stop_codon:yes gene_type:complete
MALGFKKAMVSKDTRLKMLVYGESGVGKTVTALSFPKPAVIDSEHGTDYYGEKFDYDVMHSTAWADAKSSIEALVKDPAGYKTLVIDPFALLYDDLQAEHLKKQMVKTGNPNYTMQFRDWGIVKGALKLMLNNLRTLDMNIIVTATEKPMYSQEELAKQIGVTFNGPQELKGFFDVRLHLELDESGTRWATVEKDRTNKLPPRFEFSYQAFCKYLGNEDLEREPVVFNQVQANDSANKRNVKIKFQGQDINTAGITAKQLEDLEGLLKDKTEEEVKEKLLNDYLVNSLLDLKADEAKLLIKDMKNET